MTKKKRVNALFIKNVKEKGKYPDSRGLVLVVEASGSKRWVQRLTIHGKRRDLGLGSAQTVSLSDARTIAYENLKIARSGGDPTSEKKKTKQIPKFEEAALIVYNMRKETWRNPKHAAQFLSTLRTYAYPKIGKKPVSEITSKDIHNVLEPIWVNKHETASRVLQRISVIMQWATTQQYCLFDPSQHVTRGLSKVSKAPKTSKVSSV